MERAGKMYVCKGSPHYVFYPAETTSSFADILQLEQIQLLPYFVFVEQGWLQHAREEYLSHHDMRYHWYLVPSNVSLINKICFTYGWNLQISENKRADSAEGAVTPTIFYRELSLKIASKYACR